MTRQATIRQRSVHMDESSIATNAINESPANAIPIDENRLGDEIHPVLRRILLARGITRPEELALDLRTLLPPGGLSGIDNAAKLVAKAVMQCKRILIVGDFDADGATGTAVAILRKKTSAINTGILRWFKNVVS